MQLWLIVILYLLFATTFTLAKATLLFLPPFLCIGIRMLLAGFLLLGYESYTAGIKINKRSWPLLLQVILFHIYIAYVAEFWALQYTASAKTALIYNFSPFITAFMAFFLGYERLTAKKWLGLAFGLVALVPWLFSSTVTEDLVGHFSFVSFPELALLLAVASACYGWLLVFRLMKEYQYTPLTINGIAMLGGGFLALISSLYIEGAPHIIGGQQLGPWENMLASFIGNKGTVFLLSGVYLLALITIANVICYNLYAYLLKRYSATFLSFAGFMCPLFAAILGWLFFDEQLSGYFVATLILVMCGLYCFYQEELETRVLKIK